MEKSIGFVSPANSHLQYLYEAHTGEEWSVHVDHTLVNDIEYPEVDVDKIVVYYVTDHYGDPDFRRPHGDLFTKRSYVNNYGDRSLPEGAVQLFAVCVRK